MGAFCREDLKLIVSVHKCGSTSIFNSLAKVGINGDLEFDKYNGTFEYLSDLKIHWYVRDALPPLDQLNTFFLNPDFFKVLVIRDPLERLVSAVLSKYMIPSSNFFEELRAWLGASCLLWSLGEFSSELNETADC